MSKLIITDSNPKGAPAMPAHWAEKGHKYVKGYFENDKDASEKLLHATPDMLENALDGEAPKKSAAKKGK